MCCNSYLTDLKIFLSIIYLCFFSDLLLAFDDHTWLCVYLIPGESQTTPEIQNIIFVLASLYFAKFYALPSECLL